MVNLKNIQINWNAINYHVKKQCKLLKEFTGISRMVFFIQQKM